MPERTPARSWQRRCRTAAIGLIVLAGLAGCGSRDGLSDYQRQESSYQEAAASLRDLGGRVTQKHYRQGNAWAVNLSGMQVSDELLQDLKKLGHVTELDLSKTNVGDEQMEIINQVDVGSVLLKLDLSHTAVTDAGLEKLTNLVLLQDLNLADTHVTPAGVERFRKNRASDPKIMRLFKSPKIRL